MAAEGRLTRNSSFIAEERHRALSRPQSRRSKLNGPAQQHRQQGKRVVRLPNDLPPGYRERIQKEWEALTDSIEQTEQAIRKMDRSPNSGLLDARSAYRNPLVLNKELQTLRRRVTHIGAQLVSKGLVPVPEGS